MEVEGVNRLLIRAACEILCQAYSGQKYRLVHMNDQEQPPSNSKDNNQSLDGAGNTTPEPKIDHNYFHSQLR